MTDNIVTEPSVTKKRGRRPAGERAMTPAERQRKRRAAMRDMMPVTKTRVDLSAPDPSTFSESQKQKFDRALDAAKLRIRTEVKAEVESEVAREWEATLAWAKERHQRAERILAAHKGFLERAMYRKILACLHPDNVDADRKSRFEEAFNALKALEDVLVAAPPSVASGSALPKTAAELLARRKRKS